MPYLAVQAGPNAGSKHPVDAESVILGRGPGTIQVDDKAASRRHAEIFRVGELCFIRDLESKNGTYLNETKITEEILKSGDRIRIGSTIYLFADEAAEDLAEAVSFGDNKDEEGVRHGETTFVGGRKRPSDVVGADEASQIEMLRKAAQTLATIHDRTALRRAILSVIAKAVDAEFAYFFVTDAATGECKGLAHYGETANVSISRSILHHASSQEEVVMTEDASEDERFKGKQSVVLRKIHSVLCVPLGRDRPASAVVYLGRDMMRRAFTEREMRFASLLGNMATLALEAASVHESQQEMLLATAGALVRALEIRHPEMTGHSERVAGISFAIAKAMDFPYEECRRIQIGGLLHDIGRLAASDEEQTAHLSEGAWVDPEARHAIAGEQILSKIPGFADITAAAACHHERVDGSGVPRGLVNARIPVIGRVVAVANELDNLTTRGGAQGTGISLKDALIKLGQEAGKIFDTEVVRALLLAYRRGTLHGEFFAG